MQLVNIFDVPKAAMDEAYEKFGSLGYNVLDVAEENGDYAFHIDREARNFLETLLGPPCFVVMIVPQDGGYHAVLAEESTPERQAFVNTAGELFHPGE